MKNILIINAHPDDKSFCSALAKSYSKGAKLHNKVKILNLHNLKFDPILHHGYRIIQKLEPDLINAQNLIKWANHIVFIFPNWWGTYPALFKGFIDRMWLPGFGFKYEENSHQPKKLLTNKTSELIITSMTPYWFYRFIYDKPGINAVKKCILEYSGITNKKITYIKMNNLTKKQLEKKLHHIQKIGEHNV